MSGARGGLGTPEAAPDNAIRDATLAGGLTAAAAMALLALRATGALPVPRGWGADALPGAVAIAMSGFAVALWRPRWVFLGFLLACMVTPFALEETSVPLGFMKLYAQDLVFLFNGGLIAGRWSAGRGAWRPWTTFDRMVAGYFVIGAAATALGMKAYGHEFDNAFGDFRRAFFYFMNYFVAMALIDDARDLSALRRTLVAGGALLAAAGLIQLAAGGAYERRAGDANHILSHYELTFLSFAILHSVARFCFRPGAPGAMWHGALVCAGGVVTLLGNYRAAWLGLAGGVVFVAWVAPRRARRRLAAIAVTAVVALAAATLAIRQVKVDGGRTWGDDIAAKASLAETTVDVNVAWRVESYRNALGLWATAPVFGRGLGEELEFSAPSSTGTAFIARGHRVHNSFLWILMSLGVAGAAYFVAMQAIYMGGVLRGLRRSTDPVACATLAACGGFWVSFMISTGFEIFLESAIPITVLAATMALASLTARGVGESPSGASG